jgi:hypothetical protein
MDLISVSPKHMFPEASVYVGILFEYKFWLMYVCQSRQYTDRKIGNKEEKKGKRRKEKRKEKETINDIIQGP